MSELGLSIKIGAVVGGALAALGSVQGHMERMGTAATALRLRQGQLNKEINKFVGPRTPAQLGRLQVQYDRVGASNKEFLEANYLRRRASEYFAGFILT